MNVHYCNPHVNKRRELLFGWLLIITYSLNAFQIPINFRRTKFPSKFVNSVFRYSPCNMLRYVIVQIFKNFVRARIDYDYLRLIIKLHIFDYCSI